MERPLRPRSAKSRAQVLYELLATLDTSRPFRPEWRDLTEQERAGWTEAFDTALATEEEEDTDDEA